MPFNNWQSEFGPGSWECTDCHLMNPPTAEQCCVTPGMNCPGTREDATYIIAIAVQNQESEYESEFEGLVYAYDSSPEKM